MFELLGLCLFLAALLTLNAIVSSVTTLLWRALERHANNWPPVLKARAIFTLRVMPLALSLLFVLLFVLPAYLVYEPRYQVEPISFKLGILTIIAVLALGLAIWRGVRSWLVTRRLVRNWMQAATPLVLAATSLPAYRMAHPFPVAALVGCWRPRLFLAAQLFDLLTPAELQAIIAHETGHLIARDNLKRVVLRMCCDVLAILPSGRSLDRAWAAAAEAAADEYAARAGRNYAVELASALVKIAKIIPPGLNVALPLGAAIIGPDAAGIAVRVQTLLARSEAGKSTADRQRSWPIVLYAVPLLGLVALISLLFYSPTLLASIHQITEAVVARLQ